MKKNIDEHVQNNPPKEDNFGDPLDLLGQHVKSNKSEKRYRKKRSRDKGESL